MPQAPSNTVNQAFKVDEKLEEQFAKALTYELTDEDIERAKLLIGVDIASKSRELHATATADAIRNWAQGAGDDNPLYTEEAYGPKTRWGSQIAHGTMIGHVKTPMFGDPMPEDIKRATKGLFKGVHVFVSGGTWDWYRHLYPGDRIYTFSGEESIQEKKSEFAERSVIRVSRSVNLNQRGEVVGIYRTLRVETERKKSREKGKYAELKPAEYTDEDYERIDAIYAAEAPRGSNPRYFEDVRVGEEMRPMVKGPLTVTEIIAFHAGGYGFVPYGLKSSRLGYKNRQRIKPFYIRNQMGVWDVAQRLHWDNDWAKAIGNPLAYDYGVMRQCWLYHMVSDWAGDDAIIEHLEDSIRKFNYHGDTQFLTGKVVDKREENGRYLVDLELHMVNQRDTETAYGSARVALPSKDAGIPIFPSVPPDIERQAVKMFARHNELASAQSRS